MMRGWRNHGATLKALAAGLGAWGLAAGWMFHRGLNLASMDDYYRLLMSMDWSRHPYFYLPGAVWPPLSIWIFGLAYGLLHGLLPEFWYIPCAAALLGTATAVTQGASAALRRQLEPAAEQASAPWMVPLLALSIPFAWRLAASSLAESVTLVGQSVFLAALIGHLARPSKKARLIALAALAAMQMTRLEAWPFTFAEWAILILCGWQGAPARARAAWLLGGGAGLGIFPALWTALHWTQTDFPAYLHLVARGDNSGMFRYAPPRPPFSLLCRNEGWAVLPCLLAGLWLNRRARASAVLVLVVAAAWATYALAASNHLFLILAPRRLPLVIIWSALPLAALGLGCLWDWGLRHKGGVCLLIVLALGWKLHTQDRQEWGGPVAPWPDLAIVEEAGRQAREEGYTLVIDKPAQNVNLLNLLRCRGGLDGVEDRAWLTPERAARSLYVLFTPDSAAPGRRLGAALGYQVYRH